MDVYDGEVVLRKNLSTGVARFVVVALDFTVGVDYGQLPFQLESISGSNGYRLAERWILALRFVRAVTIDLAKILWNCHLWKFQDNEGKECL